MFLLRWLRLLFAREYVLAQIGSVWDMLFASAAGGERGSLRAGAGLCKIALVA